MPSALQIANLVAYILNLVITFVAGAGKFGGKTTGTVARENETIVNPASWAIGSLWGVIFFGEGIFSVWQLLPAQRESRILRAIGWCWVAACLFQCGWMLAWTNEVIWLSTLLLCAIAVSLGISYVALYRKSSNDADAGDEVNYMTSCPDAGTQFDALSACSGINASKPPASESLLGWWVSVLPLSIHFTWACAASLVNVNASCASDFGAGVDAQYGLSITSLVVLFFGAAALGWSCADPVVSAVTAWALFAIADKQKGYSSDPVKLQQGADTYREFDLTTIHDIAIAVFVIAAIHAFASLLLMALAVWRRSIEYSAHTSEAEQEEGRSAITSQQSKALSV